ncbi:T9SS type A sorting domain-containing protein [Mangrovibacterium sp.]|uniref:T9SS type A sorting domain-containing protein n=1 Tax=Mangrovibacterium sp. TaxID=1961364 RepID=UPI003564C5F8
MQTRLCTLILICTQAFGLSVSCYSTGLKTLCRLPEVVAETSGVELTGNNEIWTINDSSGQNMLYLCDTLGNLVRSVLVNGAINEDWEELTQDASGNFYIGDIGNNENKRQNLRIYKIPSPVNTETQSVDAQTITFKYPDQTEFPPADDQLDFDCEAMIWFNHYLYLFSKNRSLPVRTNLYRIPDEPGDYVAEKIGSFASGGSDLEETSIYSYWITAADISPNGKQVALLSHDQVWVFYNFTGDDFFSGDYKTYDLSSSTQKESICFANNSTLYLTDEYWSFFDIGRNLYRLTISTPFSTSSADSLDNPKNEVLIYPNPFSQMLHVSGQNLSDYQLQLLNTKGELTQLFVPQNSEIDLQLASLPNGIYLLKFVNKNTGYSWVDKIIKQDKKAGY